MSRYDPCAVPGGIGGLLAVTVTSNGADTVYLPLTDGLGNVRGLVDAQTGALAAEYAYDPYGAPLETGGEAAGLCPFRFQTKYFDAETGLYCFGFRYYDPLSCKWLSRDPKGEAGGVNLTAYCDGDPVNNHDPFGLSWLSACFGFGLTGPEADAFDEALSDDYWSGRMGMRAGAAAASELEVLAGVGEGLSGAKVAVGSAGALGAAGYALAADGSSRIAGGAGHYLNLFDGGDRQWDAVGNAAYAAGGRYGRYTAVARDLAGAAGMAASLNRLANIASSAAEAEAQAILRQSQAASRLDSLTPTGVRSALSTAGVGENGVYPIRSPAGYVTWKDAKTGRFVPTPKRGLTIIGHSAPKGTPGYVEVAQKNGANFFRISDSYYSKLVREGGKEKVWAVDELYMEEAWKRGDEFGLATDLMNPGFFADELKFLVRKGQNIETLKHYR